MCVLQTDTICIVFSHHHFNDDIYQQHAMIVNKNRNKEERDSTVDKEPTRYNGWEVHISY